ncbi:TonB-dependent receptor plug domain-containing protein [Alteromonas sp. a30]|uniref:TonB-dependent receptor plug domain-containing protein n=1 Tax=Alteromonas sp. a30 TaxID=2730917 RepID=UPI002280E3BB|nr:TonB-dependent receptor [Alteromonas sp. a30]MCY7295006.1 TonB-dependent receptor [Alteromonas sp. a30]
MKNKITIMMLAAFGATPMTYAQSTSSSQADSVEKIAVVGMRTPLRSIGDSPVPVDLISAEELSNTGFTELNQMVASLVPSYNFPRPSVTDGTDHVRPATLRGMSPDQVLVLVNGKRRHTSAVVNVNGSVGRGSSAVDLNTIPANMIKRIEVLRDGAAAQYGSDAIAGVINIVLRDDVKKEASWNYGAYGEGDGNSSTIQGNIGFASDIGFVHFAAQHRNKAPTNRAGLDPRQQYVEIDGEADPREAEFDRLNHRFGDADVESDSIFVNSGYNYTDASQFYFNASYEARDGESGGFYRRAQDSRNVPEIYPDGFLPLIVSDVTDYATTLGFKYEPGETTYDFSVTYGSNEFEFGVNNSLNTSLGAQSQTSFDAGTLEFEQFTVNFDMTTSADIGLNNPLNMAFGAEYRDETYKIQAGEEASYINGGVANQFGGTAAVGSQVFPGFRPSDASDNSRDSYAVYAQFDNYLTDELLISSAIRFEDFSDFGTTLNGKLALHYQLSDSVSLRSAISSGFRAPSLAQINYATTATVFIDNIPNEVKTFRVNDPAAIALGAEPLDAEESINYSAGIVYAPIPELEISIDYYRIDIDDRIVLSDNIRGDAVQAILEANGNFGVNGGRYFTNAIDTETTGVDFVASYLWTLNDTWNANITLGMNFNDVDITRIAENPPELEPLGPNARRFGRTELALIEEAQPENKGNLGISLQGGKWGGSLIFRHHGELTTRHSTDPTRDQTYGSETEVDVEIRYALTENWQFALGANNLFDETPDRVIEQNNFNGIFPYSSASPYGYNGVYYYGKVKASF